MIILTSHDKNEPLVASLMQLEGVSVEYTDFSSLDNIQVSNVFAYYGNYFSEIKNKSLWLKGRSFLSRHRIPYVFWNRDAPWHVGMKWHNQIWSKLTKPIDLYLAHSEQDADWFSPQYLYFPNAAKSEYAQNTCLSMLQHIDHYVYDVAFIGAVGNEKRRACRERLSFFRAVEAAVLAANPAVRFLLVDTVTRKLSVDEQLHLIRCSKINLNFGAMCDLPKQRSWGMPERVFGIPAAGGFLLTDDRKHLDITFDPSSYDAFRDVDECVQKILFYIDRFPLMRNRAENLHRQVIDRHTYISRATTLIGAVRDFRQQRYFE